MDVETAARHAMSMLAAAVDHLNAAYEKLEKVPSSPLVREAQVEIDMGVDGIEQAIKTCRGMLAELKP
jgi:hypothetical protein